jgi:hypothetical protein
LFVCQVGTTCFILRSIAEPVSRSELLRRVAKALARVFGAGRLGNILSVEHPHPAVTLPSAAASALIGGGSIVASGAVSYGQYADAQAMHQDLVAVGRDLWGAVNQVAIAANHGQQRLFEPGQS